VGNGKEQLCSLHKMVNLDQIAHASDSVSRLSGVCAIGSPNVTVNGGPMAFVARLWRLRAAIFRLCPMLRLLG